METKGGKKKSSSCKNSIQYEVPLGYSIEDVRPNGGIEKFRSAAYANVRRRFFLSPSLSLHICADLLILLCVCLFVCFAVRENAILISVRYAPIASSFDSVE